MTNNRRTPSPWKKTEDEIKNYESLVNAVALRIASDVQKGDNKKLKELLWQVPDVILKQYAVE